jgi:hypothetical protein
MSWGRSLATGHHQDTINEHKVRLERSTWGNSKTPAWEIFIDGHSHGKELTLEDAKLEAVREIKIKDRRAGF